MPTVSLHDDHAAALEKMIELYAELFTHGGYGSMTVEMKFLKKGQKEVLVRCGKDHRFVIDYPDDKDVQIAKRVKSFQLAT